MAEDKVKYCFEINEVSKWLQYFQEIRRYQITFEKACLFDRRETIQITVGLKVDEL